MTIDAQYGIAPETHNPIETHATVATWDGNELALYETSQGVVNHRNVLADMLGLPRDKVRVIAKFIGSGFGSKLCHGRNRRSRRRHAINSARRSSSC